MTALVTAGPWVMGAPASYGLCAMATYYPPEGAGIGPHVAGGAQATFDTRSSGVDGYDIWQSESETHGAGRYTLIPPPDPSYATGNVSIVSGYIARRGRDLTEPSFSGQPSTVVGYEFAGAPAQFVSQSRCNSLHRADIYDDWVISGEKDAWFTWRDYEALDELVGNPTVSFKVSSSTISSRGLGATFTVGTPAEVHFFTYDPPTIDGYGTIAPKSVYTTLLHPHTYSNTLGLNVTLNENFDLLPDVPLVAHKMISLAVRISDLPYPHTLVADLDFEDARVGLDAADGAEYSGIYFYGTGQPKDYRWLTAGTPPVVVVPIPAAPPAMAGQVGRGLTTGDPRGRQVYFPGGGY